MLYNKCLSFFYLVRFRFSAFLAKFKLFRKEYFVKSRDELIEDSMLYANAKSNEMSDREKRLFADFLKFYDMCADDVSIPRSDILAIKSDIKFDEVKKLISSNRYARILVYNDNLDNIIGFIHIKDVFDIIVDNKQFNLKKIIRKHIVAAPSTKLMDLLISMQLKRTHIAVVVDEYGGTSGIATIEDVIEAIFGKIEDEHDIDELNKNHIIIIDQNNIIVNARTEIEEIEQFFEIKMRADDDSDTIGGLVISRCNKIPELNEIVEITDKISIQILEATPRLLKKLRITKKATPLE